MERKREVYLCELAEELGHFDDVVKSMKKVCELDADLSKDERNLLSVGYNNKVETCRAKWRIIRAIEQKEEEKGETNYLKTVKEYRQTLEAEQEEICKDCINVVDTYLLPVCTNPEAIVFYNKMKGDHYRYLAEISVEDARVNTANEAMKAYLAAEVVANTQLATTDPIRLGLALNFSAFYYEIVNNATRAFEMANKAVHEADTELYTLSEETYRDSANIVNLLRDNLNLWRRAEGDGL